LMAIKEEELKSGRYSRLKKADFHESRFGLNPAAAVRGGVVVAFLR